MVKPYLEFAAFDFEACVLSTVPHCLPENRVFRAEKRRAFQMEEQPEQRHGG